MEERNKDAQSSLEAILDERFVHSLSELVYDRISTLWHIDRDVERELSHLTATAVCVLFCLEYLSHLDGVIREELGIKPMEAKELSNKADLKGLKEGLSNGRASSMVKRILPQLKDFLTTLRAGNIEEVTKLALTGDYLLGGLEELRKRKDPDYLIWLESLPHYYRKDLEYLSLLEPSSRDKAGSTKASEKREVLEERD